MARQLQQVCARSVILDSNKVHWITHNGLGGLLRDVYRHFSAGYLMPALRTPGDVVVMVGRRIGSTTALRAYARELSRAGERVFFLNPMFSRRRIPIHVTGWLYDNGSGRQVDAWARTLQFSTLLIDNAENLGEMSRNTLLALLRATQAAGGRMVCIHLGLCTAHPFINTRAYTPFDFTQ